MAPVFLLVHGWGFDGDFWAPLRTALGEPDTVVWDLGYSGPPTRPPLPKDRPVVAIGHSFGLLWLLRQHPVAWWKLVSINGFRRFVAAEDFPDGVAPRLLDRMISRFATAPRTVYADFMERCGAKPPIPDSLNLDFLSDGLQALRQWDERGQAVDLVLAGRSDPIATSAMTLAGFSGSPIEWHDGGHLLPHEAPDWCAETVRRYCAEVWKKGE